MAENTVYVDIKVIINWLRQDTGINLERYFERLKVAKELENGAYMPKESSDE